MQLQNERLRTQALSVGYGQYLNNPRDVTYPHKRLNYRDRPSHREHTRSRSPYYQGQRSRLRSPYHLRKQRENNRGSSPRVNPNFRYRRLCYGCGSPDHLLRDRKCTPSLASIKTNLIKTHHGTNDQLQDLADEIMTLYAPAQTLYAGDELKRRSLERNHQEALEREDEPTCLASNRERQDVSFDDFFFQVSEKDVYTSRIASQFSKDVYDTQYISSSTTFDCSHIHFSKLSASPEIAGFSLDIGAPRSVIGRTELNKILT